MTRRDGFPTYYSILGVAEDATAQQIRDAYRARARAAHPDVDGSTEEMAAVNSAYRVLQAPRSRAEYDAALLRDRAAEAIGRAPDTGDTASAAPSAPSWGRTTQWAASEGSSRAPRAPRRPAPPRADRRKPSSPYQEAPQRRFTGPGAVLDVDPDEVSWQPVTSTVSVVPGPHRWIPRQRRTRFTALALALWALWTLLPLVVAGTQATVTPGEQVTPSDAGLLVAGLLTLALLLLLSRAGCVGLGLHVLAGLVGLVLVVLLQGQVTDDPSTRWFQAWIVVGVALYFVAGAAWRRPASPLPRYLPVPEAGIRDNFWWGHLEPAQVGPTAAAREVSALTYQLIEMLRTRLPGLRLAVRVRTARSGVVPHALVCGRRIALVYSVVGLDGDYRWDRGTLAHVAPAGATHIVLTDPGADLADTRRLFPEAEVRSWAIVHPYGSAESNLLTRGQPRGVRTVRAQDFFEEAGSWLRDGSPATVRQDLLTRLIHTAV